MMEHRSPGGARRHDDALIHGLNHPELGWGELALPPPAFRQRPGEGPRRPPWARYAIGAAALILVLMLALPAVGADVGAARQSGAQRCSCAAWDRAAGSAFADAVQRTDDIDMRWVADALERLRRARRLCEGGWLRLACEDYQAVISGAAPRDAKMSSTDPCLLAMVDDPRAYAGMRPAERGE
jgi:hypothetical protein